MYCNSSFLIVYVRILKMKCCGYRTGYPGIQQIHKNYNVTVSVIDKGQELFLSQLTHSIYLISIYVVLPAYAFANV